MGLGRKFDPITETSILALAVQQISTWTLASAFFLHTVVAFPTPQRDIGHVASRCSLEPEVVVASGSDGEMLHE